MIRYSDNHAADRLWLRIGSRAGARAHDFGVPFFLRVATPEMTPEETRRAPSRAWARRVVSCVPLRKSVRL